MPWTVDDPPPPAKNWSADEKRRCVAAANSTLESELAKGNSQSAAEAAAVIACIGAAGRGESSNLVKPDGGHSMADKKGSDDKKTPVINAIHLENESDRKARALIQIGRFNNDQGWSFNRNDEDALLGDDKENPNWKLYQSVHLGRETTEEPETRERYKFPFAKLDSEGRVVLFRTALLSIITRTEREGNAPDVLEAAQKLLTIMEDRAENALDLIIGSTTEPPNIETLVSNDYVSWTETGDRKRGRVLVIANNNTLYVPGSSDSFAPSEKDPAVLIELYQEVKNGWRSTGKRIGARRSTLQAIEPLPPPRYVPEDNQWFKFKAATKAQNNSVQITGEIGGWGEFSAAAFQRQLSDMSGDLDVYVNTYGGDVFEGVKVFNALFSYPFKVTTIVDGVAASTGSLILMAGDQKRAFENTMIMIHRPTAGLFDGNFNDFFAMGRALERTEDMILQTYQKRTGRDHQALKEMIDAETWMNANEAAELGFLDAVLPSMDLAASAYPKEELPTPSVPDKQAMTRLGIKNLPEVLDPQADENIRQRKKKMFNLRLRMRNSSSNAERMIDELSA